MGDLISRKALMEELFKTPKWDNRDEDVFFDLIDLQPTAYDIEKVAKQLGIYTNYIVEEICQDYEKGKFLDREVFVYLMQKYSANFIKVVREGGVV